MESEHFKVCKQLELLAAALAISPKITPAQLDDFRYFFERLSKIVTRPEP